MAEKNTTTWAEMKDQVYGEKGTERRDKLDREFKSFRIGLMLRKQEKKTLNTRPTRRDNQ